MKSVLWILLLVNGVALLTALNPWVPEWQRSGALLLIVELGLVVVLVVPSVLYQTLVGKKRLRDSVGNSLRWLVDLLGGWA
jgi:hypothetical protein